MRPCSAFVSVSLAAAFTFGTCTIQTAYAAPASTADACKPTSRTKQYPTRAIDVNRGDGGLGSSLTNIQFTLIEQMHENCQVSTSFVLDYTVYNHWQNGKDAHSALAFDFKSQGRVIKRDAYVLSIPLGFCGPYGTDGRPFHVEGPLPDNFIDIVDEIGLRPIPISGKIGEC